LSLFQFETEEEVIKLANNVDAGLASYFWTRDASRIWRVSEKLQYGMVGVNSGSVSSPTAPFGGVKQSGFGREGSHHGLTDYLDIKAVHQGI
jgi:succinate-semialdehyde dehydrogenase/glutarate-semialdehyde dehydrogenase